MIIRMLMVMIIRMMIRMMMVKIIRIIRMLMVKIIMIIRIMMVMIIFVMLLWGLPLTLQLSRPSPPTDPSLHPDHTERVKRCNKSINISTKSYIILFFKRYAQQTCKG